MLGHTYRYVAYNGTGVTASVVVKARAWKFGSDGQKVDAAQTTPFNAPPSVIPANSLAALATYSVAVDNSYDRFLGVDIVATFTPSAAATGTMTVWVQKSTDGGVTWPDTAVAAVAGQVAGQWAVAAVFSASAIAQVIPGTVT